MNVQDCQKWLRKARILLESVDPNEPSLSNLEVALLRSYLTEAYDTTLTEIKDIRHRPTSETVTMAKQKPTSEPAMEKPRSVQPQQQVEKPQPAPATMVASIASSDLPQAPTKVVDREIATLMAAHRERIKSGHIGERMIADINKAIGLNDRLQFTKHLFDDDTHAMKSATSKINGLATREEVESYLSELADKYDWNHPEKKDIMSTFLYLVARKTHSN